MNDFWDVSIAIALHRDYNKQNNHKTNIVIFFRFIRNFRFYFLELYFQARCCRPSIRHHQNSLYTHIPYLIFIVSNPCCPNKISFTKLNNPSHTTGVMSTPNAGGTDPLTRRRSGSVGQTIRLNGSSLTFAVGYHERTMRHSCELHKET